MYNIACYRRAKLKLLNKKKSNLFSRCYATNSLTTACGYSGYEKYRVSTFLRNNTKYSL
jgi:hypothetical protein